MAEAARWSLLIALRLMSFIVHWTHTSICEAPGALVALCGGAGA